MISFSETAVQKLGQVFAQAPEGAIGIRIAVQKGCSGLTYQMNYAEAVDKDDEVLDAGAIKVVVDPMSQFLLLGTEVGFQETAEGVGFTFENPNGGESPCGACSQAGSC